MIGKAGSISLICLATSQPFTLPFKPTSVTSALSFLLPPLNKVSASSPEDRMWLAKPPSANASSTTPCSGYSSSTIRIRGASGTLSPRHKMEGDRQTGGRPALAPAEIHQPRFGSGRNLQVYLRMVPFRKAQRHQAEYNRSAASAHVVLAFKSRQF